MEQPRQESKPVARNIKCSSCGRFLAETTALGGETRYKCKCGASVIIPHKGVVS